METWFPATLPCPIDCPGRIVFGELINERARHNVVKEPVNQQYKAYWRELTFILSPKIS